MIQTIPNITVNGKNTAFGGYIYALDYAPSFSDGPSTLTMNFISESGTYIEPILSTQKSYSINVGNNITLNFFAISFKTNQTPSGRTLEVKFIDASFILDKIYVGLHKQHGDANADNGPCLIVVGKELHPCDTNRDGVFDIQDLQYLIDACDPCPLCATIDRDPTARCQNISDTQILDVSYNFSELVTKIQAKGINLANIPQTNDRYLSEYTGSLRQVLQNWGSDYGFNFYWENNKLNFIDAKQEIIVDVNPPSNILLERTNSKTLEGTVARGSISRYQRAGETKTYPCVANLPVTLLPLLLKDLFKPIDTFGTPWLQTYKEDNMDLSCAFSHYGQEFRDGFWWFNQHFITGAARANAKKNINLTGLGIQIIDVIDGVNFGSSADFDTLKNEMTDPEVKSNFEKRGGYFIVVSGDYTASTKQFQYEKELSDKFIGRFFYRPYRPKFCGNEFNQTKNTQIVGVGGTEGGKIYEGGDNIKNAPIFKFGYVPTSTVGRMITKSVFMDSSDGYRLSYGPAPKNDEFRYTIALYEREGKWSPVEGDTDKYASFSLYYKNRLPALHGSDGKSATLTTLNSAYAENPVVRIMVAYSGIFLGSRIVGDNSLDATSTTMKTLPDGTQIELGLINNKCAIIVIKNEEGLLTIETPSQGISGGGVQIIQGLGGPTTIPTSVSYAGYKALATQTYDQSVFIPKVQTIKQDGLSTCEANSLSFDINFRDINDTDIKILTTGLGCVPDSGVIQAAHNAFNDGLTYSIFNPKEETTYVIAGIDIPSVGADLIKKGLVGLNISIGADGLVSSYSFSSRPPQPPNLNVLQRSIESQRPPNLRV